MVGENLREIRSYILGYLKTECLSKNYEGLGGRRGISRWSWRQVIEEKQPSVEKLPLLICYYFSKTNKIGNPRLAPP